VTNRLFGYWFDEDHEVGGKIFRYFFGQREAIETLASLVEVARIGDAKLLVDTFTEIFYPEGTQQRLPGSGIVHQTAVDGRRQIRRYIPEVAGETIQDLPPANLRRYAFKMATGSGKTVVMAMAAVWSFFHKRKVPDSDLSTNFLILAPNVIVYQRLEKDFASNRIFHELPLIPPEWRGEWSLKVILRGESTEPEPSGNLFLTNIQQVYESREAEWTPANAVDALLGRKPIKDQTSQERSMLERIKGLPNLVAMNDEAHHVHDEELQWHKSLMAIHEALPTRLSMWLDFSATPKDQNGTYFPWIVCDYPLAQAVEDRIVKAPLIVHRVRRTDPDDVTKENVTEAYGEWLVAALARWKEHYKTYSFLGPKPVLFIMTEKNSFADEIGRWLVNDSGIGLKDGEVLVIHTDSEGEITKKYLDKAREAARDIDLPKSKVKVIVSVLMLREGWDVRNVTVVLGLRPFTSSAKILPEQAIGRGLRLMEGISPDRTQTLEVMGTQAFEDFVRQLEAEGVGIKTVTQPPPPPVKIEPILDKIVYDIAIPLTKPAYIRNYKRLDQFDPLSLEPIYEQEELDEPLRVRLRMEFATTGTEVHETVISMGPSPLAQDLLASITRKLIEKAKLTAEFAFLYPFVRGYVENRCFGRKIDFEGEAIRSHLRSPLIQEGIAKYLARQVGELTADIQPVKFENRWLRLSETKEFTWRRNLPLLVCSKTIFNLVATYNDFEKAFAKFLDQCPDVIRFASLGTTEQDSGANFRVDYLKPSGAIGFYHPDWVVVQKTADKEVSWIIETKGRVWEDTASKDAAIRHWCEQVSDFSGVAWRYKRVDQIDFERQSPRSFGQLISADEDLLSDSS
jgi:type III restriction enzyme